MRASLFLFSSQATDWGKPTVTYPIEEEKFCSSAYKGNFYKLDTFLPLTFLIKKRNSTLTGNLRILAAEGQIKSVDICY